MTITIGTQWKDRNGRLCEVVDIYTTFNIRGSMVKLEYLSNELLSARPETVTSQRTVLRGIARLKGELA